MDRGIYTPDHAERLKARAGEKYRPSNGDEGERFMEKHCAGCERDAAHRRDETADGCPIIVYAMGFNIDDPKYPAEWQYGADGQPTCAAFQAELTDEERAALPPPRCDKTPDLPGLT